MTKYYAPNMDTLEIEIAWNWDNNMMELTVNGEVECQWDPDEEWREMIVLDNLSKQYGGIIPLRDLPQDDTVVRKQEKA